MSLSDDVRRILIETCRGEINAATASIVDLIQRAEGRPSPEGEELGPDDPTEGLPGKLMVIYGECSNGRPSNGGDLEVIEDAAHALAALSTPSPEAGREVRKIACDHCQRMTVVPALSPPAPEPEEPIGDYQLHPKTAALVRRFMSAVAAKLAAAEVKYGYSDGWADPAWQDECRRQLHHHAAKGDPRDVAAYAAFCWHHGWSTAAPEPGYEAEPVAWMTKTVEGGLKPVLAEDVAAWRAKGVTIDAQPLFYASPVPVAISREALEEVRSLLADVKLGTTRNRLNEPAHYVEGLDEVREALDAILQRLSNQQGGEG